MAVLDRVLTDFPACLAASPTERAAAFSPPPAERADCFARSTLSAAWLPCLVAAAFVPRSLDSSRVRLRSRVAAAFFAARSGPRGCAGAPAAGG